LIFVVDPPKRAANLAKHGLDLEDARDFDWVAARVLPAREGRYAAIGYIDDMLVVVIFRPLGTEALSIISMRRASRRERRFFHEQA
jgi:uncharacterized DUF497 family protein